MRFCTGGQERVAGAVAGFGFRARVVGVGDPSLRLKDGFAQDDTAVKTTTLSRGDFAGPLLRLPVVCGDLFGGEMHGVAEIGGGPPLSAFVGEHELEYGTENAGLAEEDGLGFVIERNAIEDFGHGHFEHSVDEREQAEKK
jgi:hypothetical protein